MTWVPYSSMSVMSASWERPPMPYFKSKRVASRALRLAAIFFATVSGDPFLVVGEVVAEQGERVVTGPSAEDDLRPSPGDGVECGVALKDPDGIARAQDRHRRPEADTRRAGRDRAEHHVGGRHREVIGVVLADSEEVDADLVGQDALLDDVPDRPGVGEGAVLVEQHLGAALSVGERVAVLDHGTDEAPVAGLDRAALEGLLAPGKAISRG